MAADGLEAAAFHVETRQLSQYPVAARPLWAGVERPSGGEVATSYRLLPALQDPAREMGCAGELVTLEVVQGHPGPEYGHLGPGMGEHEPGRWFRGPGLWLLGLVRGLQGPGLGLREGHPVV